MKTLKIIIDIFMFIITVLLMNINFTGRNIHAIMGILLGILVILHAKFNFKWIKSITKNYKKVKLKVKVQYFTNLLIFICYFSTIILGILMSCDIFRFKSGEIFKMMLAHHILGRISSGIMLVHLGFNLNIIISKLTKNRTIRTTIYIIYITLSIIFLLYLIYTLINSYVWKAFVYF